MAGIGPDDLFDLCEEYLEACVSALGSDVPDRRFVNYGPPAWDCPEQLTVHAGGPVVADTLPLQPSLEPAHRAAVQGMVNMVSLTATILRCVPMIEEDGDAPSPQDIEVASRQTCSDVWAIWNWLVSKKADGTLFPPRESRELFIDPAVAVNPQGGAAGWQITVRVQLDGYRP